MKNGFQWYWVPGLIAVSGLSVLVGCGAGPAPGAGEYAEVRLGAAATIVSLESELIGRPTHIDVDESGRVWIADPLARRVLAVGPGGDSPSFIDKEGEGPGELRSPVRVVASDSLIQILDSGNMRVQSYRPDGQPIAERRIADLMLAVGALAPDGRVAVPTSGHDGVLARVYVPGEADPRLIGEAIVPPAPWNFPAMKNEIATGRVPDQFRNEVMPVLGRDGTTWLLVQTAAEVRRYDEAGALVWSRELDVPEIEAARREFFRRNEEEPSPSVLVPLTTFAAAREVGRRLWVLMRTEESSEEAVLYVLDRDTGAVTGRAVIGVPAAANSFAVDERRGALYLGIAPEASVLAVDAYGILRM